MRNTRDILSVYQHEDTRTAEVTQRYFSIAPPFKGDGAIQISTDVSSVSSQQDSVFYDNTSVAYHSDELINLANKRKINLYREIIKYPEVDNVVNQIVADAIVYDEKKRFVHLDLDETNFTPRIKKLIHKEFEEVLKLYKSKLHAQRHFKKYYVDSKIFFHKIIDPDRPEMGILEMRELDPRLINLHRENLYSQNEWGEDIWVGYNEFFIYQQPVIHNNSGFDFSYSSMAGSNIQRIPKSAITYAHSGLNDCNDQIIGHLHQAIKPAHTLKMLEDAMVIYRVTRAPDRKVFYIDTGKATGAQAKEIMNELRRNHSSKVVYDTETGKFDNYKNQMLVTDDYWLQRQDGKANAEIVPLPGASGMNEIDDIRYQEKKLYESLKAPLSRMPNENAVIFGDDGGTSRDERMFQKFISQTQGYYSVVFSDPLMTNLILKGIITSQEWQDNEDSLIFKFNKDEYYTEIAEIEILERRYGLLEMAEMYRGKYVSGRSILKNILKYTDEDIDHMKEEILEEQDDILFNPPIRVDQYGRPLNTAELGTQSSEVEQVITPEYDTQMLLQIQAQEESEKNSINEKINFTFYK